jgi:hypothetical protein
MGVSTFGIVLVIMKKTIGSLFGTKTPSSMLGVAKMVCQTPLFSATTLTLTSFQLATVFWLVVILCDGGNIKGMSNPLVDDSFQ